MLYVLFKLGELYLYITFLIDDSILYTFGCRWLTEVTLLMNKWK